MQIAKFHHFEMQLGLLDVCLGPDETSRTKYELGGLPGDDPDPIVKGSESWSGSRSNPTMHDDCHPQSA